MKIRQAQLEDRAGVRRLYLTAFSDAERETVAGLAVSLLVETTTPPTFALVAEMDVDLVGHVGFSPMACTKTGHSVGYILAPLAVHPDLQKQRIGTRLIETGIGHLLSLGADILFVYGDPRYYGRFGFDARVAAQYVPPYQLQHDFGWQAKPLAANVSCPSCEKLTCVSSLMDSRLW